MIRCIIFRLLYWKNKLFLKGVKLNREFTKRSPVIIGDNCFIGMNSIILKGTTLGDNVVVGAGSVVHGSFPSDCIIAGNPAKIVKKL